MTDKAKSIRGLAESIQRILNGSINSELRHDIRLIENTIKRVGANIYYEELRKRRLESLQLNASADIFVKSHSSTFRDVPILVDDRGQFYSKLPAKVLKIAERDAGVWWVSLENDQKKSFMPAPHYSKLATEMFGISQKRSFWTDETENIFYHQDDYKKNSVVMVKMLVGLEDKPEDELFIDKELEALIMPQVINFLQNKAPIDLANDGSPTT